LKASKTPAKALRRMRLAAKIEARAEEVEPSACRKAHVQSDKRPASFAFEKTELQVSD
jgi:hypothetical protein